MAHPDWINFDSLVTIPVTVGEIGLQHIQGEMAVIAQGIGIVILFFRAIIMVDTWIVNRKKPPL